MDNAPMSFDGDTDHESRRNVYLAVALSVVAVVLVGGMFWVMSSLAQPSGSGTAAVAKVTTGTGTSTAAPVSTTTTTFVPPSGTWTPTSTVTLPPAEQPMMTQTADSPTAAPTTAAPLAPPAPPATTPTTAKAPAPPPPPPGPSVSNVNLSCTKDAGKRVSGKLTFTTTTKVDVILSAGGSIDRSSAGPGNVTLSTSGRGAEICFAQVAGQVVGPVRAT